MKELVRGGLGIGVVPSWSARRELASGALAAVRLGATVSCCWGVLHADLRPYPATLRAFVRLLADSLPELLKRAA